MRKFALILLTTLFFCACTKDEVDEGAGTRVESTAYVTIVSDFDPENEAATDFEDNLNTNYASARYIKVTGRMRDSDLTALGAMSSLKGLDLSDVAIIGTISVNTTVSTETDQGLGGSLSNNATHASIPKLFYDIAATGSPTLVELILPDNLNVIGRSAFFGNSKLERVIFKTPSDATLETYKAYRDETVTEEIDLSGNAFEIYPGAFAGCSSLKSISFQNADGTPNANYTEGLNTLPVATSAIYFAAFKECWSLSELDLSACVNLETIDDQAFLLCTSLTEINIPTSVSTLGAKAFMGCDAVKSIKANWGGSVSVSISDDTFPEIFKRSARTFPIEIPYVADPDTSTNDPNYINGQYNRLTGWSSYWLTTDIDNYSVDDLKSDKFGIVATCSATTGVSDLYEQLVKYYGEDFNEKYYSDGKTLRDNGILTIGGTISAADFFYMGTFSKIDFTETIGGIVYSMTAIYKGEYNGVEYAKDYIPAGAFENNEVLRSINFHSSAVKIGNRAFKNSVLSAIQFASSTASQVTEYGEECFMGCTELGLPFKEITDVNENYVHEFYFPSKYDYMIGKSAFEGCTGLVLDATQFNSSTTGLTYIGDRAFYGCDGGEKDERYIFANGSSGTFSKALCLPSTLRYIGEEAFAGCEASAVCGSWTSSFQYMPSMPTNALPTACGDLYVVDGTEGLYNTAAGWRELGLDLYTTTGDYDIYAVHLPENRTADMGDMLAIIQENNGTDTSKINVSGYLTAADISDLNDHCAQSGQGWKTIDLSGVEVMASTTGTFLSNASLVEEIIFPSSLSSIGGTIGAGASKLTSITFNWGSADSYPAVESTTFPSNFLKTSTGTIKVPSGVSITSAGWSDYNVVNQD